MVCLDKKTNQIKKGPGNREAANLQADTQEKSAYLRGCVENLVENYECEWMHQNKTSATKQKFVNGLKTVKPRRDLTQEKSSDKCKMEHSLACSCATLKHLKSSNRNSKNSAQFSYTPWFRETIFASTCVSTPSETTSSRNLAVCWLGVTLERRFCWSPPWSNCTWTTAWKWPEFMNLKSITRRNALKNSVSMCPRRVVSVTAALKGCSGRITKTSREHLIW